MNGSELLRVVDAIHRDKNIDKEIVFEGIEQSILSAARKHFGEEKDIVVHIDRENGEPSVKCEGVDLPSDDIGLLIGRIGAQTAKQVMIQKMREAERDSLFDEFESMRGHIVTGTVTRMEGGAAIVNLGKVEAILPRGEQIPGESHRPNERVRAVVMDVRKAGTRVKIILSRTHLELVRRLFELEIPEVSEHVIEVRSIAREAGYRTKVAVSCIDSKIDAVGACVGVRGSRIKSIVDELAGERIDIVRWNDSLQVLVPNALQPAEVEDVILCPMLGKVIVLVREDQQSLAIGRKGQNVRLASKLVGWDIFVMTQQDLDDQLEKSVAAFSTVPHINEELAENLVAQGFFSFEDLSVIEPDQLAELSGLTPEQCDEVVEFADAESIRVEEQDRIAAQERRAAERLAAERAALAPPVEEDTENAEESEGESLHSVAVAEEAHDSTESEAAIGGETPVPDGDAEEGTTQVEFDGAAGRPEPVFQYGYTENAVERELRGATDRSAEQPQPSADETEQALDETQPDEDRPRERDAAPAAED